MTDNELIETLKEFEEKRVEQLPENSRNLFYAIMKIADERDEYKQQVIELENMRKEIRKYINKTIFWGVYEDIPMIDTKYGGDIADILNKANKE